MGKDVAFHNLIMRLVCETRPLLGVSPTVIEFGNQTFRAKGRVFADVRRFLVDNGIAFDSASLDDVEARHVRRDLHRLTEGYYRALGFSAYDSVDVNSQHGSLIMDLNKSIERDYGHETKYDLVTNNGTGEHVFDQCSVFRNAHELTIPGGIMIHCLPCNNYVNHGFFAFNPVFFMDLAAVNEYEILKITIAHSGGYEAGYVSPALTARFPLAGRALSLAELQARVSDRRLRNLLKGYMRKLLGLRANKGPFALEHAVRSLSRRHEKMQVAAVLRKRTGEAFRTPIQGRYGGSNIESEDLRRFYSQEEESGH